MRKALKDSIHMVFPNQPETELRNPTARHRQVAMPPEADCHIHFRYCFPSQSKKYAKVSGRYPIQV